MKGAPSLEQIETREKKIAEQIAALQQEAEELAVAKRVFLRFTDQPTPPEVRLGQPRPAGAPTTFQMVDMVLANAEREGKDGLNSKDLVAEIRGRYWPGVKGGQIMPTIYGFVKAKRLHRSHGKFRRVKQS